MKQYSDIPSHTNWLREIRFSGIVQKFPLSYLIEFKPLNFSWLTLITARPSGIIYVTQENRLKSGRVAFLSSLYPAMKQTTRLFSLICFGITCMLLLSWWSYGRRIVNVPVVERPLREGVVDFLPVFRLSGIVDEPCEKNLSESLTALQHTLPHNSGAEWPKLIWQTSPSKEVTPEMNSWKTKNSEWKYQV